MNTNRAPRRAISPQRRRVLAGAAALAALRVLPVRAAAPALPEIPEFTAMLAGRTPRLERLVFDLPRIAENGNAVPARVVLPGPFAAGAHVRTLALFSERNPVRTIIALDYPVPVGRVEFETRIRLAGTQRLVALAALADNTVYAAVAEVEVAGSACLDGS
jgi:sulfur-oxidizing protein SoxY